MDKHKARRYVQRNGLTVEQARELLAACRTARDGRSVVNGSLTHGQAIDILGGAIEHQAMSERVHELVATNIIRECGALPPGGGE